MELTLIIPTNKNERAYIRRMREYYRDFRCHVIIADSAKEGSLYLKKTANFTYLHTPHLGFNQKMLRALGYVKTEFAAICGVDDFVMEDSLRRCVEFLAKNRAYSCAQGDCGAFSEHMKQFLLSPLYLASRGKDINAVGAYARIEQRFLKLDTYLSYSITHTRYLKEIFGMRKKMGHQSYLNESLFDCYLLGKGRCRVFGALHSLRAWSRESTGVKKSDHFARLCAKEEERYERFLGFCKRFLGFSVKEIFDKKFGSNLAVLEQSYCQGRPLGHKVSKKEFLMVTTSLKHRKLNAIKRLFSAYRVFAQPAAPLFFQAQREVSIYGAGVAGIFIKKYIEKNHPDITLHSFVDDVKCGSIDGVPVLDIDDFAKRYAHTLVISPTKYEGMMAQRAAQKGVAYIKVEQG